MLLRICRSIGPRRTFQLYSAYVHSSDILCFSHMYFLSIHFHASKRFQRDLLSGLLCAGPSLISDGSTLLVSDRRGTQNIDIFVTIFLISLLQSVTSLIPGLSVGQLVGLAYFPIGTLVSSIMKHNRREEYVMALLHDYHVVSHAPQPLLSSLSRLERNIVP